MGPYQVLFLILGPLVLEPVMTPRLPAPILDPEVVAERGRAHQELIARGPPGAPRTA